MVGRFPARSFNSANAMSSLLVGAADLAVKFGLGLGRFITHYQHIDSIQSTAEGDLFCSALPGQKNIKFPNLGSTFLPIPV